MFISHGLYVDPRERVRAAYNKTQLHRPFDSVHRQYRSRSSARCQYINSMRLFQIRLSPTTTRALSSKSRVKNGELKIDALSLW